MKFGKRLGTGHFSVMRVDTVPEVVLKRGWLRTGVYPGMRKEAGYRTLFCNAAGYWTYHCSETRLDRYRTGYWSVIQLNTGPNIVLFCGRILDLRLF